MLLVGASTVFAALESALQQVWGGRDALPRGWRAFVRARLISFGFILAIGFLLLVSLTLTTALAALRGYVAAAFRGPGRACSRRWISCCRSCSAPGWSR